MSGTAERIEAHRRLFPADAGLDENLAGYLRGLEDALRILRGEQPGWKADGCDAYAARRDPWQGLQQPETD